MVPPMAMASPSVPQGLPQGHGAGDEQTCPYCGQPLVMPFNQNESPQVQMPQGAMPPEMGGGQGGDPSALIMALLGGGGMPGGMGQ